MSIGLIFAKGKNFSIEITHKIEEFLINYYDLLFDDIKLEELSNLSSILNRIRTISNELKINPEKFIIEFQYDVGCAHCLVDEYHVLLLSLPIKLLGKKIVIVDNQRVSEDYLLYHELMHAREVLDGRFPSCGMLGPEDYVETLIGRLNDFANEGKLEAMSKPHETKEQSIENIFLSLLEDCEFGAIPIEKTRWLTKETVASLCDKVWGKDLTYLEAHQIIMQLINE